jgi:hypothetical protein
MDVLSEVLQQVRLNGAVLFRAELSAPWCIAARPETAIAELIVPRAMHLISFHVVLDGCLWARLGPAPAQCVRQGEVLIVPHGHAYTIGDGPQGEPVPAAQLFGDTPLSQLRSFAWGGGGAQTRVMCGYLGCERSAFAPLFAALPPLFKVRLQGSAVAPSLDPLLAYTEQEILSPRPGAEGLRLRMAELMFVEALRRYMAGRIARSAGRARAGAAARRAATRVDRGRARARPGDVALAPGGALQADRRRTADAIPEPLAHPARRTTTARMPGQRRQGRRVGRLRFAGGVPAQLQALHGDDAGTLAA